MHSNEAFLAKLTDEQIAELMAEAEAKGRQFVLALKEQLARVKG